MELYLLQDVRLMTWISSLSSGYSLFDGDFFPGCGFLIAPSALPGASGAPRSALGLLPRRNPASGQAWPGLASLDTSLVLATCYLQPYWPPPRRSELETFSRPLELPLP